MTTALSTAAAAAVGAGSAAAATAGAAVGTASPAAAAGSIDRSAASPTATPTGQAAAVAPTGTVASAPATPVTTPPATHAAAPSAPSAPTASAPTTPIVSPTPPPGLPAARKSISAWVSCSGTTDDTAGVASAFAAAKNHAFTLVVDCPVNVKIGSDIGRTLFIDDGTAVQFTGAGKFTVDNVMIPAFVIADSSNISLIDWNVEYVGGISVKESAGYENRGQAVTGKPGNAFNDVRLTDWLAAHKGLVFNRAHGGVMSQWTGTTNACAVFYLTGDSSSINVTGMHMYVPPGTGDDKFIPVAFSIGVNYKRNQVVTAGLPLTAQHFAVPHDLVFSNVTLDGTYMGWVGGLQKAVFENIHSLRYGDLQDANGRNVGGVDKWFAPPHLFYFSFTISGDPGLYNTNIQIRNVVDEGIRLGSARDKGGADGISGYATSFKVGCFNCSIDSYQSSRPDGLMDIFNSDGLTVTNVTGTYNSAFTHNLYPGWRFPASSYKNVKFDNISLTDLAPNTISGPIGNAGVLTNQGIVMSNVQVVMNNWGRAVAPFPAVNGTDNNVAMTFTVLDASAQHVKAQTGSAEVELVAQPTTIRAGRATTMHWLSRDVTSCSRSGSWSGSTTTSGSQALTVMTAGVHEFSVTCRNAGSSTTATATVVVSP